MDKAEFRSVVIDILKDHTNFEGELTDATPVIQLKLDSLDWVESIMELEEKLQVKVPDTDPIVKDEGATIGQLVEHLWNLRSQE